MSSFVNLLKNLFSGLSSFLGGLFNSKKAQDAIAPAPRKARNSGYFLELDEAKSNGSVASPAQVSSAVTPPMVQTAQSSAKRETKADSTIVPTPVKAVSKQVKKSAESKSAPKESAPKQTGANTALNLPQPTVTTFAPEYLAPNGRSNGRRRPGANMSSFLDMARQIKPAN